MRKRVPLFMVGRMVKTVRYVPGSPVGLPTGALVDIVDVARLTGGTRYQVKSGIGVLYWVDADAIEALGSPAHTEGKST